MARLTLSPRLAARMGNGLRRAASVFRWLGGIAFILLLGQLLLMPKARIVTLEARSQGMELEFSGGGQEWQVAGAHFCQPGEAAPCPLLPLDVLSWQDGTRIEFTRPPGLGKVILWIRNDRIPGLPDGSRLEFDDAVFRDNGQQFFRGYVTLGAQSGSGRRGYLWQAEYQFFERDPLAVLTGSSSVPVREGELIQGDQVSVICRDRWTTCDEVRADQQMLVLGHAVLELSTDEKPGFDVVLTSAKGDVELRVTRYGVGDVAREEDVAQSNTPAGWWPFGASERSEGVLRIRPTWVDTILTNPTFLALTIILTFIASLLQAIAMPSPSNADRPRPDEEETPDKPAPGRQVPRRRALGPVRKRP